MSARVLEWLWQASWQVTALVVAILIVQRVFARKLTPRAQYALWLLVVARLVVPIQPELSGGMWRPATLGLVTGLAFTHAPYASPSPRDDPPGGRTTITGSTFESGAPLPEGERSEEAQVTDRSAHESRHTRALAAGTSSRARPPAFASTSDRWPKRIVWIWFAGALATLLWFAAADRRFRRRARDARPIGDPELLALLDECRDALGVRRDVRLVETSAISSPAVTGVRRPTLLLPPHVTAGFDGDELRLLMLHELAHVRGRDVELNHVLVLVRSAFWFHPAVAFALARLRAAQEALCDWKALASPATPSPRLYANTLIKLLDAPSRAERAIGAVGFLGRGTSIKRRILMITRFPSTPATSRMLSLGLALPLTWIAFTSAAPALAPELDGAARGSGLARIVVEGHDDTPAWKVEMQARLDETPITVELVRASLAEVVDQLRAASGMNFVLAPGAAEDYADAAFSVRFEAVPLARALETIANMTNNEIGACLAGEAVYVDELGNLPHIFETRIYNIAPLLVDIDDDRDGAIDTLTELLRGSVRPDTWDCWEGVYMDVWQELLVVSQTAPVHGELRAFLDRLLNRGAEPAREPERWAQTLAERLDKRIDASFERQPLGAVVDFLSHTLDITVLGDPNYQDEPVTLDLRDVRGETALRWIASLVGLRLRYEGGVVYVSEREATELVMYEVGDLVERVADDWEWEELDNLDGLIRDTIDPTSWDSFEDRTIEFWRGLLIVRQSPENQRELARFFDDLRRAMR